MPSCLQAVYVEGSVGGFSLVSSAGIGGFACLGKLQRVCDKVATYVPLSSECHTALESDLHFVFIVRIAGWCRVATWVRMCGSESGSLASCDIETLRDTIGRTGAVVVGRATAPVVGG